MGEDSRYEGCRDGRKLDFDISIFFNGLFYEFLDTDNDSHTFGTDIDLFPRLYSLYAGSGIVMISLSPI